MDGEMIWLTRQQLATLFGRDYKTISKHINNALKEELADEVVVAKFANTTQHGAIEGKTQNHEKEYFNLERTSHSKAASDRFIRPLEAKSSIRV